MRMYYCVARSNDTTVRKVFTNFDHAKDYVVDDLLGNGELPGDYDDVYERCDAEGWSHIALPAGIVEIAAEDESECFQLAI